MQAPDKTHSDVRTRALCGVYTAGYGLMAGGALMVIAAETPLFYVGLAVLGALVTVGAIRGSRVSVVEDTDGLTVRNPLRTYRVEWQEATALSEAQPWWFKGLVCPVLHTTESPSGVRMYGMVAWDRVVSSEHGRSARRFGGVLRRWQTVHGLKGSALS